VRAVGSVIKPEIASCCLIQTRRKAPRAPGCRTFTGAVSRGPGRTGQTTCESSETSLARSSCRAAGADAAVPGMRHGASEDGSIAVKALPAMEARRVRTRGAPGGARERVAVSKGASRAQTGITDARLAGMRTCEGASRSSRPKLAPANSNANLPRFSQRELCWAPEGSLTGRWCVVPFARRES